MGFHKGWNTALEQMLAYVKSRTPGDLRAA
jgi:hypothetical protein